MAVHNRKKIVFTVTNNLNFDQRMHKICTSLSKEYDILLVGVAKFLPIIPLQPQPFAQKRLSLFFKQGFLSFAESNLRFFFFLLFKKFDAIGAVDLDTIIPVYFLSVLKRKKRVYDAHELFCETHSIVHKPRIYKVWKYIESTWLPCFTHGYTVNTSLAQEYERMYGLQYTPVLNVPPLHNVILNTSATDSTTILYQGVVNKGRGFEYIIPAMKQVNATLVVCGSGSFLPEAKALTAQYALTDKVIFKGQVLPAVLQKITPDAYIGLNTLEGKGKSYYLSLSNRTFDYMHAAVPQIAMKYPEYEKINETFEIALLIEELSEQALAIAINRLLHDKALYNKLKKNCEQARLHYNWENEEKKLKTFYKKLFENK